jgi:hypothetical protein
MVNGINYSPLKVMLALFVRLNLPEINGDGVQITIMKVAVFVEFCVTSATQIWVVMIV